MARRDFKIISEWVKQDSRILDLGCDGSWKTSHPVYLTKKWVHGGSKRGLY